MIGRLIVRADATPRIGTGHVMRCLALAHAWRERGGTVTFASHCTSERLIARIRESGARFHPLTTPQPDPGDLETVAGLAADADRDAGPTWIVLDGYHFAPAYQLAVRATGHRVLIVDDFHHHPQYHADVLLNQNIGAPDLAYATDSDTQLLLGTQFALLRPEFIRETPRNEATPEVARRILVTLGGADPDNATGRVVSALATAPVPGAHVRLVLGASNPNAAALKSAASSIRSDIRLEVLEDVTDMPRLMAWADLAVCAGGSTCWELAYMGVPGIILVLADNQMGIAEGLHAAGAFVSLGWFEDVQPGRIRETIDWLAHDSHARARMTRTGQWLVDGKGALRVVDALAHRVPAPGRSP